MKVLRYSSPRMNKVHLRPPPLRQRRASKPRELSKDKVILSSRADEVRKLTELAKSVPDVRRDKIEAIRKRIESGTYRVPARSVAKSIIDLHREIHPDTELAR